MCVHICVLSDCAGVRCDNQLSTLPRLPGYGFLIHLPSVLKQSHNDSHPHTPFPHMHTTFTGTLTHTGRITDSATASAFVAKCITLEPDALVLYGFVAISKRVLVYVC